MLGAISGVYVGKLSEEHKHLSWFQMAHVSRLKQGSRSIAAFLNYFVSSPFLGVVTSSKHGDQSHG